MSFLEIAPSLQRNINPEQNQRGGSSKCQAKSRTVGLLRCKSPQRDNCCEVGDQRQHGQRSIAAVHVYLF